jgi:pimeloyl-ACP methyl ester carboxylesterase
MTNPLSPRPPLGAPQDLARLAAESHAAALEGRVREITERAMGAGRQAETIAHALSRHLDRISKAHGGRAGALAHKLGEAAAEVARLPAEDMRAAATAYAADFMQRWLLTLDAFRKRGDLFLEHERDECPPVLVYDHEVIADGRDFERSCNYRLLRIVPPADMPTIDRKRPYVIIDPRAGHGAGIGGFKLDSQVGVALGKGHPVYFMAFTPDPVPTQTLADVTHAEAEFVRIVMARHPESNKPIIIGNCQGGWATALLAATNPDITGPVVFNGAPMAYWSGRVGENPMRYNGGLLGGVLPAMVLADLAGGKFDGAHLVQNFEFLNPSRNFFGQYYDLFRSIDDSERRFLEFQKWWGGYFWMTEAEIRWIVENLFIGNKLARGEAELEPGRFVNLKAIRAPIIVFASHGDNITPPQQALNWIVDAYASEEEIRLSGQRIVYMVHEKVGHLGIFVSSSVAKREHSEMASTMKTIEALAPGLYEMVIEDVVGEGCDAHFYVSFHSRKLTDIDRLDDGRDDEKPLAAVARASELAAEIYDVTARPFVRAASAPMATEIAKALHPLRVQRWAFASWNPWMRTAARAAEQARAARARADDSNPFVAMERLWAESLAQSFDFARDIRDMAYEAAFYGLWAHPAAIAFGAVRGLPRAKKTPRDLRLMPEVQSALMHVESGGFVEAVIRMLIMLAEARGSVRRDRLERSARVLAHDRPFCEIAPPLRGRIIHEQSIIAQFEPDSAIAALPKMIPVPESRVEAMAVVEYILGPLEEMESHTIHRLQAFREALGLDPIALPEAVRVKMMTDDALKAAERAAREAAE